MLKNKELNMQSKAYKAWHVSTYQQIEVLRLPVFNKKKRNRLP